MGKYGYYEFEIRLDNNGYIYNIKNPSCVMPEFGMTIESDEWFESKAEARFAAIGHIDLLENGEG